MEEKMRRPAGKSLRAASQNRIFHLVKGGVFMKIAILNGSPKVGNTAAMVNAFAEGAK